VLLDKFAAAFENADVSALAELLRADAVFEMPPLPAWFAGRDHICRFLRAHVLREPGALTMIATSANGQPALAAYRRGQDGVRRAYAVQVLTVRGARVARIDAFLDPGLFTAFGLPATLPETSDVPHPA
jgi:RNA polymerase sigma-70 factor (ECF subfamily)